MNMTMYQHIACPLCNQTHDVEMEEVRCNLCQSSDQEFLFNRTDLALGLAGTFSMVRCRSCGLIYMNPRPTISAIGYYYPSSYEIFNLQDTESGSAQANWSRSYQLNKRCKAIIKHKKSGRILDVGCATGQFLHQMRLFGQWERKGVELIPAVAEQGRDRYGLDIHAGMFEEAGYPEAYFDVVSMWDVMEHVHDPAGTVREAARVLEPDGILAMSLPIGDSLGAKVFGRYWVGYETPRHLHVFTRETLTQLLEQNGFRFVEETVLYGSNYAFADSVRFTLRGNGAPRWMYGGVHWFLRHWVWRWATAPLFKLLDKLGLTTNLTLIWQKK
jgi:SAM-dependent methyltransferase